MWVWFWLDLTCNFIRVAHPYHLLMENGRFLRKGGTCYKITRRYIANSIFFFVIKPIFISFSSLYTVLAPLISLFAQDLLFLGCYDNLENRLQCWKAERIEDGRQINKRKNWKEEVQEQKKKPTKKILVSIVLYTAHPIVWSFMIEDSFRDKQ